MLPRVNMIRTDNTDYLLFSTDDLISRYIHTLGQWESANLLIAELFCEGVDMPLVLDVGANLGAFAVPLAQKLMPREGLVYCFEPQRVIFYQLCANIFLNRLDCCIANHVAISDQEGILKLTDIDYAQSSNIGGYSLVDDYRERTNSTIVTTNALVHNVPIRTLDSFDFPRPVSLLKIDVEGMELNVLKGAEILLRASSYPPIMFKAWDVEWFKEQRSELLAYVEGLGYELFFLNEMDVIAQHKLSQRLYKFVVDPTSNTLSYYVVEQS